MHQLDAFQHEVLDFMTANAGRCIYADPVGSRKTGTTLTWLESSPAHRVLVVAPKAVHGHWEREAERYAPKLVVSRGLTKVQRHTALQYLIDGSDGLYITTYESMKGDEELILKAKFDTVVFDEGHRLKGRTTAVAKVANRITRDATRLVIVTGTPIMNHADETWQYLHMLDRRAYTSFTRWTDVFFDVEVTNFHGTIKHYVRVIHDLRQRKRRRKV